VTIDLSEVDSDLNTQFPSQKYSPQFVVGSSKSKAPRLILAEDGPSMREVERFAAIGEDEEDPIGYFSSSPGPSSKGKSISVHTRVEEFERLGAEEARLAQLGRKHNTVCAILLLFRFFSIRKTAQESQ